MKPQLKEITADLQEVVRLTRDGINGVTRLVESVHHNVHRNMGLQEANKEQKTNGLTGFVYRRVRGITNGIAGGLDRAFTLINSPQQISAETQNKTISEKKSAWLSVINGLIGDHLAKVNSRFVISMQFRSNGNALSDAQLKTLLNDSKGNITLLIHGLCMNDHRWRRKGIDHGSRLMQSKHSSVIYLNYNSGLPIYQNGQLLNVLLQRLDDLSTSPLSLNIIAHSMGGLLSRSAMHYAMSSNNCWLEKLKNVVFLGTPHHGALLEKSGQWLHLLLETNPYTRPFGRLTHLRSAGIKDLRHGRIVDNDSPRFSVIDKVNHVPLPTHVKCYAIAAHKKRKIVISEKLKTVWPGDGLVTIQSALGEHKNPQKSLSIANENKAVIKNINHMQLTHDDQVYAMIKKWLT